MRRVSLIILPIILLACNNVSTEDNSAHHNLREYFYDINSFDSPKVHVLEQDSLGIKSQVYYHIEKIDSNELRITMYNSKLDATAILIDKFTKNGVHLKSYNFLSSGAIKQGVISDNRIFSFKNLNQTLGYIASYSGLNGYAQNIDYSEWKYEKSTVTRVNGEDLNTLVFKGFRELQSVNSEGNKEIIGLVPIEVHYTQTIGITKMKDQYGEGNLTLTYLRTISHHEFIRLKGAAANNT